MGESSVSCTVSGLSMHNEEVVFIPLSYLDSNLNKIKRGIVFGDSFQSTAVFAPHVLPIKCKIDNYTRLLEVEKNTNTKIVEDYYGTSIEEFLELCLNGKQYDEFEYKFNLTGCFVHPEVYKYFSRPINQGKYAGSLWTGQNVGIPHLEGIGCKLVEEITEKGEKVYIYRHPKVNLVEWHTDGFYCKMKNRKLDLWCFTLKQMHRQLAIAGIGFPGFPPEDRDRVKNTLEIPQLLKYQFSRKTVKPIGDPDPQYQLKKLWDDHRVFKAYTSWGITEELFTKYREIFLKDQLLAEVSNLYYFLINCSSANRLLMPTITGYQYPEHNISRDISRFIASLAQKRLEDYARREM